MISVTTESLAIQIEELLTVKVLDFTNCIPRQNLSIINFIHTDSTSYMHPVSEDDLRAGKICCSSRRGDLVCLPEFADVAVELMAKHKLEHGQTPTQAKQLFSMLIRLLENLLFNN